MKINGQIGGRDALFQLRGNTFTMMVLKVMAPDDPEFYTQLLNKIRQAPNFFRNAPLVLDLDDLREGAGPVDFADMSARLRAISLVPVGFQGGTPDLQELARAAGLPAIPAGRPARAEPAADDSSGEAPPAGAPPIGAARPGPRPGPGAASEMQRTTLIVTEPVRSGQQVYAPRGDLVVLAPVSAGAEVLADGNIHIYSSLRGLALAGITGDAGARIFCMNLEAELVSIAGLYRVSEDLDRSVYRKQVQIWLDNGYLRMDALA